MNDKQVMECRYNTMIASYTINYNVMINVLVFQNYLKINRHLIYLGFLDIKYHFEITQNNPKKELHNKDDEEEVVHLHYLDNH